MGRLLGYELKKMARRPFTLVVSIGSLVVLVAMLVYAASETFAYAWGPEKYGSYAAIPEKELEHAHSNYGLTGNYEGTLVYNGFEAIALEKEYAAPFEGAWDEARLHQMARDYMAFRDDAANYTSEIDDWGMQIRSWSLADQGMSAAEIEAYDAANPMYLMRPEAQYGKAWQQWGTVSYLLEEYVINNDGSLNSFEQVFPYVQAPAAYSSHAGPSMNTEFQAVLVGILALLTLLAGVSPIFSEEVTSHTEPMLLAAKYGRSKLVWAKLWAGLLWAAGSLLVLSLAAFVTSGLCYGFEGYAMPIQLELNTISMPYALNYGQYLLLMVGLQLLGLWAMAAVLMLLSALIRSAIPVVFAGGLLAVLAILLASNSGGFWRYLCQLLPPGLCAPLALLYDGRHPGLDFLPLAQLPLALILCCVLLIGCSVFILRKYRRLRTS